MKNKIFIIALSFIDIICFFLQRKLIKMQEEDIINMSNQLILIQRNNEVNITDLQNRNNELINRNEELQSLFHETEEISNKAKKRDNEKHKTNYNKKDITIQDCINSHINNNIVKLLQKTDI